jgi:hypothetical protein
MGVPRNAPCELESLWPPDLQREHLLAKNFFLGYQVQADLKMEFFNILNRVIRSCMSDTDISDGSFGLAPQQCQSNAPRQGQAYFRISFE